MSSLHSLVGVLLVGSLFSQSSPDRVFSLSLSLVGNSIVNEGQLVLLQMQHQSPYEQRFQMPLPPVRYQFAGFLIDPPLDECGRPNRPCFLVDMLTSRRNDNVTSLDLHQQSVQTDLNTYTPPIPPGKYKISAVMHKLVLTGDTTFGYAKPDHYLVSNSISIEVRPATEEWRRTATEAAWQTLLAPRQEEDFQVRERAARQLAAIDTPQARVAAIEMFGRSGNRELLHTLARNPAAACELMKARAAVPGQILNTDYAYVTSYLCSPKDAVAAASIRQDVMSLMASRADQAPVAEARAMREGVLRYGSERATNPNGSGGGNDAVPDFVRTTARRVAQDLPSYNPAQITGVLGGDWPVLRDAGAIPALETLIGAHLDARDWVDARRIALTRLNELDAARGRTALLKELTNFRPTLDEKLTSLLPASALPSVIPDFDDRLLDYLSRSRRGEVNLGADADLLIARYLSPRGKPRFQKIFEANNNCQPGFLAYFVRVDPAYADAWLRRTPWNMHQPVENCLLPTISAVPRLAMSPQFEAFLIAYLRHEQVPVKWQAAMALRIYGSANAKKPLLEAFQYFHDWWKDRRAELEKPSYQEGRMLEDSLYRAISDGRAWLTSDADLKQLSDLCITNRCRQSAAEAADYWLRKPLRLEITTGPYGDWEGAIAHYNSIATMEAIKRKLAQFPKGTEFKLSMRAAPADRARIEAELRDTAKENGLNLKK